jgi:hypothetical protein
MRGLSGASQVARLIERKFATDGLLAKKLEGVSRDLNI